MKNKTESFIRGKDNLFTGERMKPGHLFAIAITATVFISTFFISQGIPTGFLVKGDGNIGLRISGVDVSDTTAKIEWKTGTEAMSIIAINGNSIAFETAKSFRKEITGLTPGKTYRYVIRACNENKCEEKSSELTTESTSPKEQKPSSQITGAAVGVDMARTVQKSISFVFYALIGIVVLVIAGRVGYEKIASSRDPMQGMVEKAKKLVANEQYEQAYEIYSKARQAYSQLEEEAKLKHYDSLISIYQSLNRYAEVKEAQRLAEKYANGTITREELRRLNEILAS